MRNRMVQIYNDRISQHILIDRLKGKTVDLQVEPYKGVPYLSMIDGKKTIS